jgi:hypothetical protein
LFNFYKRFFKWAKIFFGVSLGTSHFHFIEPIELWKNINKLNKNLSLKWVFLLVCINEIYNDIKTYFYYDFLMIKFEKGYKSWENHEKLNHEKIIIKILNFLVKNTNLKHILNFEFFFVWDKF